MSGSFAVAPRRPLLISFSGLDGSGKSTQIDNLRSCLSAAGYRSKLLAFWDHVVVLPHYREAFVHKVYNSEIGVGAPGKPVHRRDKNVRRWYLTILRHALYLLDAVNLAVVVGRARRSHTDVLILDRYIYDEWANLPLRSKLSRAYIRIVRAMTPEPDIAYLLDADPAAAHARKPEYPVDFMHECRAAYYRLARLLGRMTLIPPLELDQAKQAVEAALMWYMASQPEPRAEAVPASTRVA